MLPCGNTCDVVHHSFSILTPQGRDFAVTRYTTKWSLMKKGIEIDDHNSLHKEKNDNRRQTEWDEKQEQRAAWISLPAVLHGSRPFVKPGFYGVRLVGPTHTL